MVDNKKHHILSYRWSTIQHRKATALFLSVMCITQTKWCTSPRNCVINTTTKDTSYLAIFNITQSVEFLFLILLFFVVSLSKISLLFYTFSAIPVCILTIVLLITVGEYLEFEPTSLGCERLCSYVPLHAGKWVSQTPLHIQRPQNRRLWSCLEPLFCGVKFPRDRW